MASYDYPFTEFLRDFDAFLPPLNAAPRTFGHDLHVLREHVFKTYTDRIDRLERFAVLAEVGFFISEHIAEFDTGQLAVRGSSHNMVSDCLLQAIQTLICARMRNNFEDGPTPSEVRALAEKLEQQQSDNARNA